MILKKNGEYVINWFNGKQFKGKTLKDATDAETEHIKKTGERNMRPDVKPKAEPKAE